MTVVISTFEVIDSNDTVNQIEESCHYYNINNVRNSVYERLNTNFKSFVPAYNS